MLAWAIIATFLLVVAIFIILNLMRKYEKLEEDSENYENKSEQRNQELAARVVFIDNEINAIDKKGSFVADDEVGFFFTEIKKFRELLREYIEK